MKIKTKIVSGYGVVIGVTLLGAGIGLFLGNYYQQKALEAQQQASKQRELLSTLQIDILYNRPAKQLTPLVNTPDDFRRETSQLIQRIDHIKDNVVSYNQSHNSSNLEGLDILLEQYVRDLNVFKQKVEIFLAEANGLFAVGNNSQVEKLVVNLVKSKEFVTFIEFPNQLRNYYEDAIALDDLATIRLLKAENLRTQITLYSVAISIILGIVLSLSISNTISRPIQNLNALARQITQESDFSLQANVETKDEVGMLADSLNKLITYVRDLLEQERVYTTQLKEAKTIADEANQAKSEFLANMSHELRTPLNGILGYAQILSRSTVIPEKERNGIQIIYQCGSHLLTLINDILDLSKIEARKLDLNPNIIHLASFLQGVVEICRVRSDKKGIEFIYDYDHSLPTAIASDEKRLRQVLINLINNAIKFTDKGRVIFRVTCLNSEGYNLRDSSNCLINFEIEDTGIGIAKQDLEKIFHAFEQVGTDKKRYAEGTGLGLAISQKIVELMDSKIEVKSKLGKGSTFSFTINVPLSHSWNQDLLKKDENQIIGYEGESINILVVDDRWENRSVLVNLLEPIGFIITEAKNGAEALNIIKQKHFDLIITDIVMPVMDGYELIKTLRNDCLFQDQKIIVSSASVSDVDRQMCIHAGGNDFLPKPVDVEELLELLTKYLHLTWKYTAIQNSSLSSNLEEEMLIPPQADLQMLLTFAEDGLLSKLTLKAEEIANQNPRYLPFIKKVLKLAKEFEIEEIESLIHESLNTITIDH
ncbi:ATP-binding protein [Cyanobacterium sp. DS4]|uniref:ATP-binding protein n=1 Tax=Cyanobacterium sp. DS4 TaxID=2878255 RepID=UPI002E812AFF|nr:ATP-binding protein [Cyanobacterium sp. Dongsha4]WVL01261.1 response regulator [Cyanobacterium sp. Dongsha4]